MNNPKKEIFCPKCAGTCEPDEREARSGALEVYCSLCGKRIENFPEEEVDKSPGKTSREMNHEIKFRIWDNRLEIFSYFDIYSCFGKIPADSRNNIQRFTGMKDKNGEDIYEGDFIKAKTYRRFLFVNFISGQFCAGDKSLRDFSMKSVPRPKRIAALEIAGNNFQKFKGLTRTILN